jgi:hypothetical protein
LFNFFHAWKWSEGFYPVCGIAMLYKQKDEISNEEDFFLVFDVAGFCFFGGV